MRKSLFALLAIMVVFLCSGAAIADISVAWTSPPDGTSYALPASVSPTGQASASGVVGGTGLDLALVIDTSGSMWGTPIATAKTAAIALVNALPQDTSSVAVVGFSSYSNTYQVLTPLNPNKAAVISAINSLGAGGGTYIGSGITRATQELLNGHTAGRAMTQVVLSDGVSGGNPATAAAAAYAQGITVHSVGILNHSVAQMQAIATAGNGVYTAGNLASLVNLFNGTGGNLVGVSRVDVTLPDGTVIADIAVDGLGNFILPAWTMQAGANVFSVTAYDTSNPAGMATAELTLYGTTAVPEPSTMLLLGAGLLGMGAIRRKIIK